MKIPLQITFHNMDPSPAIESRIIERAAKLDHFHDRIMSCRVVVEAPHHHRHKGNLYQIRIDLKVPGKEIFAKGKPDTHDANEDIYVAIRDAFDAARRQLEDYARHRRGDVKHHEIPAYGVITELHPEKDYGRIRSSDGREIYFHRNSIINKDFDSLSAGDEVRYVEENGEEGPQASTVQVIGKHHIAG